MAQVMGQLEITFEHRIHRTAVGRLFPGHAETPLSSGQPASNGAKSVEALWSCATAYDRTFWSCITYGVLAGTPSTFTL